VLQNRVRHVTGCTATFAAKDTAATALALSEPPPRAASISRSSAPGSWRWRCERRYVIAALTLAIAQRDPLARVRSSAPCRLLPGATADFHAAGLLLMQPGKLWARNRFAFMASSSGRGRLRARCR